MAKIVQKPVVEVSATFELNEDEMQALLALTGYGIESFLRVFYEKMGKTYLEPHEKGLRSLFESVKDNIPQILHNAKRARNAFNAG